MKELLEENARLAVTVGEQRDTLEGQHLSLIELRMERDRANMLNLVAKQLGYEQGKIDGLNIALEMLKGLPDEDRDHIRSALESEKLEIKLPVRKVFSDTDLEIYGWHPGGLYLYTCKTCEKPDMGHKRQRICRDCAVEKAVTQYQLQRLYYDEIAGSK